MVKRYRGILLDTTPSPTLHVPEGASHCVNNGDEYVLAVDYDRMLAIAKDWMRQYAMYAHRSPERTEEDIAAAFGLVPQKSTT